MRNFTISSRIRWWTALVVVFICCQYFTSYGQIKLAGPGVSEVKITPDSTTLVVRGDLNGNGIPDLHAIPVNGGDPILLDEIAEGGNLWEMRVTNTHVVYRGKRNAGNEDIYSARLDGTGMPVELITAPDGGDIYDGNVNGDLEELRWQITPDGTRVIFVGRLDDGENDSHDLWISPINGGGNTMLLEYTGNFWGLIISNTHAVIRGRIDGDNNEDLYTVPLDGSSAAAMLVEAADGGDIHDDSWGISPDGTFVVYGGNLDGDGNQKLVKQPIGTGTAEILHEGARNVWELKMSGGTAVFRGRLDDNDMEDLFTVPIAGGTAAVKLVEAPSGGDISDRQGWQFTPDGNTIVYGGRLDPTSDRQLYVIPATGGTAKQISTGSSELWEIRITNHYAVVRGKYSGDQEDIMSVPLDGSREPVVLATAPSGGDIQ
ncbi:MAG: hypothetical protein AAFO69_18735, partial [Bacteroidota bacterium]